MTDAQLDALLEKAEQADTRGFDVVRVPKEDMFALVLALREAREERDGFKAELNARNAESRWQCDPDGERIQLRAEASRLRAENERLRATGGQP